MSPQSPTDSQPVGDAAIELAGRFVAFCGKLGGVNRREAQAIVRNHGGTNVDLDDPRLDLIIIGADELPLGQHSLLDEPLRRAAAEDRLQVASETELWHWLGYVERESHVRRLYTPAMLADLLQVPVAAIRRWHRHGLIVPVREVHRLPYFDFQEVANARRLAELVAAGVAPGEIQRQLDQLARFVPEVERPLAQLPVIVEGHALLLRHGQGLIEPGGQRRFDFEALRDNASPTDASPTDAADSARAQLIDLASYMAKREQPLSIDEILEQAADLADEGNIEQSIECYRAVLFQAGPTAEVHFLLAEALYRIGDTVAARERYYAAIELDEDYVEARANLGCVLAELGEPELAVAAFEGALARHPDYPDVHFHLARTLQELNRTHEAHQHWQTFVSLAPESPWADEAREHLGLIV
ncbi:MAG: tetratricopeptide repeat protein [Pirellulaceae bacterium]|nr:tetratricopeptide repeat protein [Planctomycetales bacterium]